MHRAVFFEVEMRNARLVRKDHENDSTPNHSRSSSKSNSSNPTGQKTYLPLRLDRSEQEWPHGHLRESEYRCRKTHQRSTFADDPRREDVPDSYTLRLQPRAQRRTSDSRLEESDLERRHRQHRRTSQWLGCRFKECLRHRYRETRLGNE